MLALHSCDDSQLQMKNIEKNFKKCKIRSKSEHFKTPYKNLEKYGSKSKHFKTPYKNLEKYGSFSEFRSSTEKSLMLATLYQ